MGLAELEAELSDKDINNITLPYVIKNHILMSPGSWNNFRYTQDTISNAYVNTNWSEKNCALFWEHFDKSAKEWVGEIKNPKFTSGNLLGDVYIVDKQLAVNLAYGAKFGISPKVAGLAGSDKVVRDATFENFSIVLNPAVKTTFLNSEIKEIENKMEDVNMADENKVSEAKNEELSEVKKLITSLAEEMKFVKEEMAKKKKKEEEEMEEKKLAEQKELEELRKKKKDEEEELKKKKDEEEELKKKKYPYPEEMGKKKYPYPEEMSEEEIKELEEHLELAKGELFKKAKAIKAKNPKKPWKECIKEAAKLSEDEDEEEEKDGPEGDVEADMKETKQETKLEEKPETGEKQELMTLRELDSTKSRAKYSCLPSDADIGMAKYLKHIIGE